MSESTFLDTLRTWAPALVVGAIIVVIVLVLPMSPKRFSLTDTFRKGPFKEPVATPSGSADADISLQLDLEAPAGFRYKNSPLERLRGETLPVRWRLEIRGLGDSRPTCFDSGDNACTFKIGSSVDHLLTVPTSGCAPYAGDSILCGGRTPFAVHHYYDIVRSDSPVVIVE